MSPALPATKVRFALLAALIFAADQWTKWLVESRIPPHSAIDVLPGFFQLTHVRNTGIAFGMFASYGGSILSWAVVAVEAAAMVLVATYFRRTPPEHRRLLAALSLVFGGALGNVFDRVVSGAVTDFLGFYLGSYRWPDFNLADSAIVVGVGLLLLDSLLAPAPTQGAEAGR
jgi:signal peptidase II